MSKKFIVSAFADEAYMDIDKQLPMLNRLGIEYFEPRYVRKNVGITSLSMPEVKEIKKKMDNAGVKASCIGAWLGKSQITDPALEVMDLLKKSIEIAHTLDTKRVRTFSFYFPEGDTRAMWRNAVMERLAQMAEIAGKEGIILQHENEHKIYGESPEDCLDIFKTVNSPALSGTFDPANFIYFGYETYPHAYELLKDHITYFHIKDAKPQVEMYPAGDGDGKIAEILKAVPDREEPYFLTIEPHIGDFQGIEKYLSDEFVAEYPERIPRLFVIAYRALIKVLQDINASF